MLLHFKEIERIMRCSNRERKPKRFDNDSTSDRKPVPNFCVVKFDVDNSTALIDYELYTRRNSIRRYIINEVSMVSIKDRGKWYLCIVLFESGKLISFF